LTLRPSFTSLFAGDTAVSSWRGSFSAAFLISGIAFSD